MKNNIEVFRVLELNQVGLEKSQIVLREGIQVGNEITYTGRFFGMADIQSRLLEPSKRRGHEKGVPSVIGGEVKGHAYDSSNAVVNYYFTFDSACNLSPVQNKNINEKYLRVSIPEAISNYYENSDLELEKLGQKAQYDSFRECLEDTRRIGSIRNKLRNKVKLQRTQKFKKVVAGTLIVAGLGAAAIKGIPSFASYVVQEQQERRMEELRSTQQILWQLQKENETPVSVEEQQYNEFLDQVREEHQRSSKGF